MHVIVIMVNISQFDSFVVPLEFNLTQYGYWNDRNDGKQIFWAGPPANRTTIWSRPDQTAVFL